MVLVIKRSLPASAGDIRDVGLIPGLGRSVGGGHGNPLHYSLAWRITQTEELGRLHSLGSHRVGHDRSNLCTHALGILLPSIAVKMLWDHVCRPLIHSYTSDDDIIIVTGVWSFHSSPPLVSHLYMTPLQRVMERMK